jgi:anti-sigma-K factor RskA
MTGTIWPPDGGHDAAPYLLGALEPGEARAFEDHLEGCAVCRDEVAALAPVLQALPGAAPTQRVPRGLRRRVLRAVRAEPKATTVPPTRTRTRAQARAGARGWGGIRPVARSVPAGWLALGATMIAAGVVGQLGSWGAHDRVVPARVGHAQLRVAGGHGELVVAYLPPLEPSRTYELWIQRGGRGPAPSTRFGVTTRGSADVNVPGDLHGVTRLLVTAEPRGGSVRPTSGAVIQIVLDRVPPATTPT